MRKLLALLLTLSGGPFLLSAQQKTFVGAERLSPAAIKKITDPQPATWWLLGKDIQKLRQQLHRKGIDTLLLYSPTAKLVSIRAYWQTVKELLEEKDLVRYADRPRIPKEELTINGFDAGVNQLNTAAHYFNYINGEGLVLSVKERRPDTADIDLRKRWLNTPLTDPEYSAHATIMATMSAGAGNSHYTGKGPAWGATISSSSFRSLLPDSEQDYQQFQISVQNHSYGTGIENYYGADALAYDASVIQRPSLLHVFSAGNEGDGTSTEGRYAGIPRVANLTGSFKMAKNILTVGAIDDLNQVTPLSSRGPAYDGRIKPELLAFGQEGSSGAAAIVSGIALQIQQAYREQQETRGLPPAALVKAILINSADDAGKEGPDFTAGYGNANAYTSLLTASNNRYTTGTLQQNETFTFDIDISIPVSQLKITLCWSDPPGDPLASQALVNDLDLSVEQSGTTYLPWILSHTAHADSLQKPARRAVDTVNNTEQVTIAHPLNGTYKVSIRGSRIQSGPQSFALAWQADTANQFSWYSPLGSDPLRGGRPHIIRWASTFDANTGKLEYSTDDGNSWQTIQESVLLATSCIRWEVPAINSMVRLRMTVNNLSFESEPFVVSTRVNGHTGFNCPDSFFIGWNKSNGIDNYQVYSLGENDQYLQPLHLTSDTNLVLQKATHPQRYFAIAPVIAGKPGQKSFAFDYTTQGVACYFKNFLAHLINPNAAELTAELGSLHGVRHLVLEKAGPDGFEVFNAINTPADLHYSWNDAQLRQGNNTYRIRLEMTSGAVMYSNPESVFTALSSPYIIYPNPVAASGMLRVFAADYEPAFLQLYNAQGQLVKQQALTNNPQDISLAGLKSGVYFLMVWKKGNRVHKSTVMVQ